jgi:nitrogenase-stabilizing/protective protein
MGGVPPELAGLSDAEDFFEALGVPFQPAVLSAHRLQIMKLFGLASESWLEANPAAPTSARRDALVRALREAHAVFAEESSPLASSPFGAPRLVRLGRRP